MAVRHTYEVLVGGSSVYRSGYHETSVGKRQAVSTYNEYVKKSKEGTGWASGQGVLLLQDDKPVRQFVGYYGNPNRRRNMASLFRRSSPGGGRWDKESKLIGKSDWYAIAKDGTVLGGPYYTKQQAKDENFDAPRGTKYERRLGNPKVGGVRFELRKVPLNKQGYDRDGHYWGTGAPLYFYQDYETGDLQGYIRSSTKAGAVKALADKIA